MPYTTHPQHKELTKSKGHIAFIQRRELFVDIMRALCIAPISDVIDMNTLNRFGRYECMAHQTKATVTRLLFEEMMAPGVVSNPVISCDSNLLPPVIYTTAPESYDYATTKKAALSGFAGTYLGLPVRQAIVYEAGATMVRLEALALFQIARYGSGLHLGWAQDDLPAEMEEKTS